jgi:hypothetical protein
MTISVHWPHGYRSKYLLTPKAFFRSPTSLTFARGLNMVHLLRIHLRPLVILVHDLVADFRVDLICQKSPSFLYLTVVSATQLMKSK